MTHSLSSISALAPFFMMLLGMLCAASMRSDVLKMWRKFVLLSGVTLVFLIAALCIGINVDALQPWLKVSTFGLTLAILVQLLGTVIAAFSARYLEGEHNQPRYLVALAGVLAAVHLLLLAGHWLVLIAAWALVGVALQHLLCFYQDRPFALLAAHKKRLADRLADVLLMLAAALVWYEVGSGSFSDLWLHLSQHDASKTLQLSAIALVLAVIMRTALLPVHGWLIQVMEAPTPVSALLHAGVVNLGGFVLIRFAPLLQQAILARTLLIMFGLSTAVLAGMVMLTRISIKVRLAWSTVAQMGFMLLECGLGMYTLAALHLIGHSLYKAHTFLSASAVVRQTKLQTMHDHALPSLSSMIFAPVVACMIVLVAESVLGQAAWPLWWSMLLSLAWAPMLWQLKSRTGFLLELKQALFGVLMIAGLTVVAMLAHALPLGIVDHPEPILGIVALVGMFALYLGLVVLQVSPQILKTWRRWSYAGFYVDEVYTRVVLKIWSARWIPEGSTNYVQPTDDK